MSRNDGKGYWQKMWRTLVWIAVVLLSVLLLFELAYPVNQQQIAALELADFALVAVLGFDLVMKYRQAPDKAEFVKRNWLEIIVTFPFAAFARLGKIFIVLEEARLLQIFKIVGASRAAVHADSVLEPKKSVFFGERERKKSTKPEKSGKIGKKQRRTKSKGSTKRLKKDIP